MNGHSIEITSRELDQLAPGSFLAVDLRNAEAYDHGCIPGAVNMDPGDLLSGSLSLPRDKKIILYGRDASPGRDSALSLRERGYDALALSEGYGFWALDQVRKDTQDPERCSVRCRDIEMSLTRKFRKDIFSRFTKAIVQYQMLSPGDRVAVCISGGKDSMLMAKLFQELLKHDKFPFELVFLCMDPGYSPENRQLIEENGKLLGIPLTIFDSEIFDSVFHIEKSPCYLCARMRRGHLYARARELGCNKIALGHHYDDVIETVLMGMLYSVQFQAMMPKLRSTNFEGMELILPLYFVREEDIKHWRDYNGLHFIQCACRFTDTCTTCRATGESASKRLETKTLIARLKETNPQVEKNILKTTENVVLNKVLGYKKDGVRRSFLEDY